MTHLAAIAPQLHPESFYRMAVSLAGELATFTETRKRPPVFPAYKHDDLHATFRPVMAALRQALSAVLEQTAVPIPLQERKFGIRVGPILDRSSGHRGDLGAGGQGAGAGRDIATQLPEPGQDRSGRTDPRTDHRRPARHRRARLAGGAAATAILCRNELISNWIAS